MSQSNMMSERLVKPTLSPQRETSVIIIIIIIIIIMTLERSKVEYI